jgi:hypothetical protein
MHALGAEVVEATAGVETLNQMNKPWKVVSDGLSFFDTDWAYHMRFLCD